MTKLGTAYLTLFVGVMFFVFTHNLADYSQRIRGVGVAVALVCGVLFYLSLQGARYLMLQEQFDIGVFPKGYNQFHQQAQEPEKKEGE